MEDVIIIGAGIVGSFLAYDLSHYQGKVTVLERQNDIANEVTMANSAIIHAGYDPEDGTLKAKLNVLGARMYPNICKDIDADYQAIGSYVVAHDEEGEKTLKRLAKRCEEREIFSALLSASQLREQEPNVSDEVTQGLWVRDTAIIYPWQTAIHLMESAVENGVKLHLNCEVDKIEKIPDGYRVYANNQSWETKVIVNAAGLGGEKVAGLVEEKPFTITRKRGQYFVLSKQARPSFSHILYPVPTAKGKGVLVVPTTHGNTLLGPNSEVIDAQSLATTGEGLAYVKEQLTHLVKNVPYQEIIRTYSGIRPCGNDGDFYIQESKKHPGIIHVACIDSPGLASAPAISKYVLETFLLDRFSFTMKKDYEKRKKQPKLAMLSEEEKQAYVKQDPRYGHIICRCEGISEMEIIQAIHSPCGARSIKGVKKRVRPGMGKCQGGFCEVEVAKILARELHLPLRDVLYDTINSKLGEEVK